MNALEVKREPMGRWWERLAKAKTGLVGNTHRQGREGEYCCGKFTLRKG
jgi:hypothetical protein